VAGAWGQLLKGHLHKAWDEAIRIVERVIEEHAVQIARSFSGGTLLDNEEDSNRHILVDCDSDTL
jgi:hypothetical protein